MNRNHFIYIVCGAGGIVLGWLFPLVFILLDLTQLGENIGWEQISFVTRSQDIYLFSFIVFPFVFSTLFISFRKVLVSKKELVKTHELLKQEEKKAQLNSRLASLGVLSAGIGHEINNPLSILILNGELLEKKIMELELNEPLLEKRFATMKRSAERIDKIVQGLRMMAREEGDEKEVFDCHELLNKAIDMLCEIYQRSGVLVSKELKAESSKVSGSVVKFQQVIMNLLSNAKDSIIEHDPEEGGNIKISTINQSSENILIIVRDNGMGISEENQNKIYDTFFTTKDVGKGSGMGLSISLSIIKEMSGEIYMESRLGKGAKFEISLPLCSSECEDQTLEEMMASANLSKLHGRVLLVEDEVDIREAAESMLLEAGMRVVTAGDGVQALERLKREQFDAIVTDLKMPNMSGEELILNIINNTSLDSTPIIVTTGGDFECSETDRKRICERIFKLIPKPYNQCLLEEILEEILTKKDLAA